MARNFTRSSRGQRGSAASSSTRSLKASQDSSRESKREPSGTVATLVSGTLTARSIVAPLSSWPKSTHAYHGAFVTSEWILASASGGRIGPARGRPEVDEEIPGVGWRNAGRLRRTHRVLQRLEVIAVLPVARVDASKLPEHADEVRLTAQREPQGEPRRGAERGDAEVLAVQHGLGLHQLLVEALQRQAGGEDRVLHVEEAVVERGEAPRLGVPDVRARVRGRYRQVHDLWHRHRAIAHDGELPLVPARVGDDVDRDGETDLPRHFESAKVLVGRDALAVELEAFLVQRLEAEEHVVQPQAAPVLEDLAVPEQDVAAGLEVVLLADPKPFQLMADGEPMLRMNERDIVHQEDVGLGDSRDVRGRGRRGAPMASSKRGAINSPSPRTTQSRAPCACSSTSLAMNEMLCPPANRKQRGRRRRVSSARSITSGTLAR